VVSTSAIDVARLHHQQMKKLAGGNLTAEQKQNQAAISPK